MEILERRENNLLNRVELTFQWDHPNDPTPSLTEMIEAAAKSEPGSNKDFVFVKNVDTRFGMPRTSGLVLVYGSEDSASIEPDFVRTRHNRGAIEPKPEQSLEEESDAPVEEDEEKIDGDGDE